MVSFHGVNAGDVMWELQVDFQPPAAIPREV
jgi:hypothetical protein